MSSASKARQLRKDSTDAERRMWALLRNCQFADRKFRRQVPIGPYVVDFVCLEKRLIVELDGGHHMTRGDYDAERTKWLMGQGFRIIRFWNNQVLNEAVSVLDALLLELEMEPSPSPVKGEGVSVPSPLAGEG